MSVNGFMVTTSLSCDVISGKRAKTGLTFFASALEEHEIKAFSDRELGFRIFNKDNRRTIADTETLTIDFAR